MLLNHSVLNTQCEWKGGFDGREKDKDRTFSLFPEHTKYEYMSSGSIRNDDQVNTAKDDGLSY